MLQEFLASTSPVTRQALGVWGGGEGKRTLNIE